MTETSAPRAMSDSTRWLPMKLAPPVTATLRPSHSDFPCTAASDEKELPLAGPGSNNVCPPGQVSAEGQHTMRTREWTAFLPRLHSPYLDSNWKGGIRRMGRKIPDARVIDLSSRRVEHCGTSPCSGTLKPPGLARTIEPISRVVL